MSYGSYMGCLGGSRPCGARGARSAVFAFRAPRFTPAFTLIELILVMAILTFAVSVTAPTLSHFFRGRTLDSEARRLLALTHIGQSRAVSEGIPMDLWMDEKQGSFGLQMEPSYEKEDSKMVEFDVDSGLQIVVVHEIAPVVSTTLSRNRPASTASVPRVMLARAGLPTIRFLPDGSISDGSPQKVRLTGRDGKSLWLAQTREHTSYEIRNTED